MDHRRAVAAASSSARDVLGVLREARIVSLKPVLPAEILSLVLDHVGADDLASCARVSKRMREMVYDDTRWVKRLKLMGCWSEAAARTHGEAQLDPISDKQRKPKSERHLYPLSPSAKDAPLILLSSPTSLAHPEIQSITTKQRPNLYDRDTSGAAKTSSSSSDDRVYQAATQVSALDILDRVKSHRGFARQEYGKVHAFLGTLYKDAVSCEVPANAKVFRIFRDPEHQAKMVAQLLRFSCADFTFGWEERSSKIQMISQAFENAMYSEFEQGLQSNDIDGKMKKYAHVLHYLNGGNRSIGTFTERSALLSSPYRLGSAYDCISSNSPLTFLPNEYLGFLGRLATSINGECSIIARIFPKEANVAEIFLGKINDVVLGPYILKMFEAMRELSDEQYVKALPGSYLQSAGLIESVKLAPGLSENESLRQKLQSLYESVAEDYLEQELSWFRRRSETEVTAWERQLSQQDASLEAMYMAGINRQADKRDFLSSFRKVVMAPVNIFPTISFGAKSMIPNSGNSGLAPSRSASRGSRRVSNASIDDMQRSDSGHKRVSRSPSPATEPPTTELEAKAAIMQSRMEGIRSLFSLEVALSLVHMAKASIERATIFAKSDCTQREAARTKCEAIFNLMLQTLGERHVRRGFNQAVDHMSGYNPRTVEGRDESQLVAPLVTFLELVNVGDLIQQMVDVFYEEELVGPNLTDKTDFLNDTVQAKRKFEQMLDERVAAGLNKGIEVLIAEVEFICATTQSTEDFNPGSGLAQQTSKQIVDIVTTDTAKRVVDLVSTHTRMLVGSTDKNMLEVFNQEVGLRLFGTLCKHLKRQRISVAGAPRLMSDMNHYFMFVQTLRNNNLLQYFKALRELSQIYLIDGGNAKELATVIADHDRFSGIFGAEEVLEFAERRTDWYQVRSKVEKAMYGIGCAVM